MRKKEIEEIEIAGTIGLLIMLNWMLINIRNRKAVQRLADFLFRACLASKHPIAVLRAKSRLAMRMLDKKPRGSEFDPAMYAVDGHLRMIGLETFSRAIRLIGYGQSWLSRDGRIAIGADELNLSGLRLCRTFLRTESIFTTDAIPSLKSLAALLAGMGNRRLSMTLVAFTATKTRLDAWLTSKLFRAYLTGKNNRWLITSKRTIKTPSPFRDRLFASFTLSLKWAVVAGNRSRHRLAAIFTDSFRFENLQLRHFQSPYRLNLFRAGTTASTVSRLAAL